MIRFVASRSLRNWHIALAAVVASWLLIPRAAEASCGDYVQFRGPGAPQVRAMPGWLTGVEGSKHTSDHGAPYRPCQGPNCSGGSFPPPQAPAPTVVVVTIKRCALASMDSIPSAAGSFGTLAEPSDLVLDGFRSSILRPPR